jgi:hypothetical protein
MWCSFVRWRSVTLPFLSIRSRRTRTPAPTEILGPEGLARSRAWNAASGGRLPIERCGRISL